MTSSGEASTAALESTLHTAHAVARRRLPAVQSMDRSAPSSEDDVFVQRGEPSTSSLASNRLAHAPSPSPLAAPSALPPRQYPDYSPKSYGLGFSPPIRRSSPLNPQKASHRRSLQSNVTSLLDSPPHRHRRIPSPGIVDMTTPPLEPDSEVAVFSNEYDLAHEDPRILLDVQRALKLKARREARLKKEQSAPPSHHASSSTSTPQTPPELSHASWRTRTASAPSSPTPLRNGSISTTASDPDFSPATGAQSPSAYPHPVPTSLDNGKTLDWTGSYPEDDKLEKRWPRIGKKKDKEKILPFTALAEQQEHLYHDRLEKIRASCSTQTQRKASITREQLGRRYRLLSEHSRDIPPFHFLSVARWYSSVDRMVKQSLEKLEPFSWLRHLERDSTKAERSVWHLSALAMEEYVHCRGSSAAMPTIPEASTPTTDDWDDPTSNNSSPTQNTGLPSPDAISFEPRRDSLELAQQRKAKTSTDSGSSLPTSPPSTTRSPFRISMSPRQYHKGYTKGDSSSAADSGSDMSERDLISKSSAFVRSAREPVQPSPKPQIQVIVTQDSQDAEQNSTAPVQIKLSTSTSTKASEREVSPIDSVSTRPAPTRSNSRARLPRRIRVSHPSIEIMRHFSEDNEDVLNREYESRIRLLEEAHAHNHRIRQTLNRISAAVREYDTIQNSALKTPGIPHLPLPKELVEAFSHDPAAVTGPTRRLRGWRAVEDIHQRVTRQREVFNAFLSQPQAPPLDSVHILDSPIEQLNKTLDVLEREKDDIMRTATNLTEFLQKVQKVHREVKQEYNMTVSRTSVVYPELSHLVALEENYRDQYQQLWDLGMDALTLLLDTVTPFWRNYGKTIGEDVRDFLIIPLYRNEFTGESKRYPLHEIPKRSFRHWAGLIVCFFASIGVTFLQIRAAITCSANYRLQWIPYDGVRWTALPFYWIGILIQWIAVLIELSIVVMQLGIVTWWAGWLVNIFQ